MIIKGPFFNFQKSASTKILFFHVSVLIFGLLGSSSLPPLESVGHWCWGLVLCPPQSSLISCPLTATIPLLPATLSSSCRVTKHSNLVTIKHWRAVDGAAFDPNFWQRDLSGTTREWMFAALVFKMHHLQHHIAGALSTSTQNGGYFPHKFCQKSYFS